MGRLRYSESDRNKVVRIDKRLGKEILNKTFDAYTCGTIIVTEILGQRIKYKLNNEEYESRIYNSRFGRYIVVGSFRVYLEKEKYQ